MADWRYRIEVNSGVQRLHSVGPLIPGAWSRRSDELNREIRGDFLLDTGAYGAMIDLETAELLHLPSQGMRDIHGIHGYGTLQQFVARVILPAKDPDGRECWFEQVMDCIGVPSLREKSREQEADVIGILGRVFLQNARLEIDGVSGYVVLQIGHVD
jgi:hypothetical protein